MEVLADVQGAETESSEWTGTRRKRIRGRFRATLAGLLELEVLRVRHKEMVETALGVHERPGQSVDPETQQGHEYWVEESSAYRLKLKRSLSQENIIDSGKTETLANSKRVAASHSSEDLQQLYCPDRRPATQYEDSCSRASSGFCESDFGSNQTGDTISSLSTSLASLSYRSSISDVGYSGHEGTVRRRPILLKTRVEHREKSSTKAQVFSQEVIPQAGFLSVVDLYPDSHWPEVSDILQPQVVLEPSYRSDLKSCLGSEVYRYPSPLHAVALQSPLYAPQSPIKHRKRNDRSFPGTSTLNLRPNSVNSFPKQTVSEHAFCCHPELPSMLMSSLYLPGKYRCMDIILKRAQFHYWSQSAANGEGINTLSRRSMASLQRTCSMGKSATSASFKFKHFQSRNTGACASDLASLSESGHTGFRERPSTHRNRLRRHTAALTNLDMFKDSNGTSVPCGVYLDRRCSVQDNARPHTAAVSRACLEDTEAMPWPATSRLSPIPH